MKSTTTVGTEHSALAKSTNLPISTKHCVEISHCLRYKTVSYAKKFLQEVVNIERAVPFRRFTRNVGHKARMASGRFPSKAAREFLRVISSAEANAQVKGLNASALTIIKLVANRAPTPRTGVRQRYSTHRTHLEVVLAERKVKTQRDTLTKKTKPAAAQPTKAPKSKIA